MVSDYIKRFGLKVVRGVDVFIEKVFSLVGHKLRLDALPYFIVNCHNKGLVVFTNKK
jgi:hypothetical protein